MQDDGLVVGAEVNMEVFRTAINFVAALVAFSADPRDGLRQDPCIQSRWSPCFPPQNLRDHDFEFGTLEASGSQPSQTLIFRSLEDFSISQRISDC